MVKLITCTCKQDYQDKTYGKGRRVANETKAKTFRCTGCGKEVQQ